MQIEHWKLARLTAYKNNARTHSPAQIEQISRSIQEFGWTNPVLVDKDGVIIAGHGRLEAAKLAGITEIPVIVLGHLSEPQRRALVIADNAIALNAGWNDDLLQAELQALQADGFDMSVVGFSDDELADLLEDDGDGGGLTDENAIPEVPVVPVSVPGDLWVLGRHRVICGDATDADTVARVLGKVKPHLMVTDPPYGVNYDPTWRAKAGINKNPDKMGKVLNDERADWREAWALFPGDVAYVWHGALHATTVAESLTACGFDIRSQIIWAKDRLVLGRGHYHWQHEPCVYAVRRGATGHWAGDRSQTTLWPINAREDSGHGHGTQKPVEAMRRPILNNSSEGQAVYEPFCGSGTTIIAAEQTGRACYAIELDPKYCDVAVKRWQEFTGQHAILEGDDRTFAEVEAAGAR